jgi:ABC-type phosphate transport system substrate-binding protein
MIRLALLLSLTLALLATPGRAGELAVVVNRASPLSDLSSVELVKYFKAEKTKTPGGTKLTIVMQDAGRPERDAALKFIYKMSEAEYSEYFVEATFTGAVATAPKTLSSGAAVKKFVAETPGGLGYVFASETDDSVKVLKIDGKSPGEADYKLKVP